jgi:chromosome partitioning protein
MFIAVTALKGGVGKTTTAIHLAAYLQQKAPTLLIDADKNRSALHWSREDTLPFFVASQAGATRLIQKYTHIITDTQARPEVEELEDLVNSSDLIILPTTPNHLDVDVTLKAIEMLQPMNANFKILLTRVDARTRNGKEARKTFQELQLPVFKAEIPLLIAFEKASTKGAIVRDISDPRARTAWRTYESVGQEILASWEN